MAMVLTLLWVQNRFAHMSSGYCEYVKVLKNELELEGRQIDFAISSITILTIYLPSIKDKILSIHKRFLLRSTGLI